MTLVMKDELLDAQLIRALAYARFEGADVGECVETGRRIRQTDLDRWFDEWFSTAKRVEAAAVTAADAGQTASARQGFLTASNYFRTAGLSLMTAPVDDRLRETTRRQRESFRRGAALLRRPPEIIDIPYEGTTLPGYLFLCSEDPTPRPTVILTDGYDGTVEELYFSNGAAALERGYNVLAFDGPGQGSVILDQGLPFRPDWENVVTPVVDFALTRPEIDGKRLALIGWSFGGYLAPRAATVEHRLAACVSDCGPYDLYEATLSRLPEFLAKQLPDGNSLAVDIVERAMNAALKKPSAGWALRRNLWVHGVKTPEEFLAIAPQYSLKGREHLIQCPTLVTATAGDDLSATAETFADRLTCEKKFVRFGEGDDVSGHCEMTGRSAFHRVMFDWLDAVLS